MIFLLLCLLSIIGFFSAIFLSGTIMCIMFSIFGVLALVASFAYLGLILLSSVSLLIYIGLFIVLFFIAKRCLPEDREKLKSIFFCMLGLIATTILWYTASQDNHVMYDNVNHIVFEKSDNNGDFILLILIIFVGVLSAILSKYNRKNNIGEIKDDK